MLMIKNNKTSEALAGLMAEFRLDPGISLEAFESRVREIVNAADESDIREIFQEVEKRIFLRRLLWETIDDFVLC